MKYTYWLAEHDDKVQTIRRRTRKEIVKILADMDEEYRDEWEKPRKVTAEYRDTLDLIQSCLSEGNGLWEYNYE